MFFGVFGQVQHVKAPPLVALIETVPEEKRILDFQLLRIQTNKFRLKSGKRKTTISSKKSAKNW